MPKIFGRHEEAPIEQRLTDAPDATAFTHADWLGRKILRGGKFICKNVYKYQGNFYTVIAGRVVERLQAERYHEERRLRGLDQSHVRN